MMLEIRLTQKACPAPLKDDYRDPATGEWHDKYGYDKDYEHWNDYGRYLSYFRITARRGNVFKVVESPRFHSADIIPETPKYITDDYASRKEALFETGQMVALLVEQAEALK